MCVCVCVCPNINSSICVTIFLFISNSFMSINKIWINSYKPVHSKSFPCS